MLLMSVELDRDVIEYQVRVAIRKHVAGWKGSGDDMAQRLGVMLTEIMFDVAGTTDRLGPEQGIRQGLAMVRNWQDR